MVTSHDTGITHAVISEKFYEFQVEYNPVCIDWFSMCTMETQSISGDAEGGRIWEVLKFWRMMPIIYEPEAAIPEVLFTSDGERCCHPGNRRAEID